MTAVPLSRLLAAPAGSRPVVAWDEAGAVSFERFRADVAANAARLVEAGCRRGALVCRDSYMLAVGLFALLHARACPVMPATVQPGALDALAGAFDTVVGDGDGGFRLEPAVAIAVAPAPLEPLDALDAVIDFFTSGSTGEPKRVTKPLVTLEREIAVLDELWGARLAGARVLATVSHQHVYGLTFKILWPLAAGRAFHRRAHDLWEAVVADLPSGGVLVTGPSHLTRIAGLPPLSAPRRPRMALSAGAPLPAGAAREAASVLGVAITEIFGSSETGVIASRSCDGDEPPWRTFPGVALEIGDHGALRVRSPFLAEAGWYETGDIAEITADGFRPGGRADRVVKIEGKRASLPEIERNLIALPWVEAAAVTVLAGEPPTLGAAVALTPAGRASLAELGEFRFGRLLRKALSASGDPAAMPRRWRFPDRLPVDALGKRPDRDIVALFDKAAPDGEPS